MVQINVHKKLPCAGFELTGFLLWVSPQTTYVTGNMGSVVPFPRFQEFQSDIKQIHSWGLNL